MGVRVCVCVFFYSIFSSLHLFAFCVVFAQNPFCLCFTFNVKQFVYSYALSAAPGADDAVHTRNLLLI